MSKVKYKVWNAKCHISNVKYQMIDYKFEVFLDINTSCEISVDLVGSQ